MTVKTRDGQTKKLDVTVTKRDGRVEDFSTAKIVFAVKRCCTNSCSMSPHDAKKVADDICDKVVNIMSREKTPSYGVEDVQRLIIQQLWASDYVEVAEQYQNYREERRKARSQERQISAEEAALIAADVAHFDSDLRYYQFLSKYSRWNEAACRRETWRETCNRVMGFMRSREALAVVPDSVWSELDAGLYNHEATCALRVVQMAGPSLERCNVGAYNCAALDIDCLEAFAELLYVLMQGSGVGFSVESDCVDQLPRIRKQKKNAPLQKFVIPDSTEGWCDALLKGVRAWAAGYDVEYDYSLIRLAGAKLKTKGGRASGPEPLRQLLTFTRERFIARENSRLTDVDCHDICCMIGKIVQVGGVRRASEISISDLDSEGMRFAKHGAWWEKSPMRDMANNSSAYDEPPDDITFMKEWLALAESGSGERGIFNRYAINLTIPKRRKRTRFIINPCQPGFATVLTPAGIRTFDDIDVGSEVWSGKKWTKVVRKLETGVKQVFRYVTTAGTFVGTEDHKVFCRGERVKASEAEEIDTCQGPAMANPYPGFNDQAVVDGWVLGDGMYHKASDRVVLCLGTKDSVFQEKLHEFVVLHRPGIKDTAWEVATTIQPHQLPRVWDREVPDGYRLGGSLKARSFLRGLYAANGSVCGGRVTLKATSLNLIRQVQEILSSIGISSYYTTNPAADVTWPDGQTFTSRVSYDLNITTDRTLFRDLIGFIHQDKADRLDQACRVGPATRRKRTYEVITVEPLGEMPVYDITVEADEHSYWTGGLLVSNCGEIILRSCQFCNLSIVVARYDDTVESLRRKVRLAAIWGTLQSTLTKFGYIRDKWRQNCEEERLLGVDITGQMDCPLLRFGAPGRAELLRELAKLVIDTNAEFADMLGIPRSAATTCVKPSGNSGQFFQCSSGVHTRYAEHQIRRFRAGSLDPLTKFLQSQGVPWNVDPGNESLVVFDFLPEPAPKGTPIRNDLTALQQLEYWLETKRNWAEHSVSCTIYVEPHEWIGVGYWVYTHFDEVNSLSFLPKDGGTYRLMPNEEVTAETYRKLRADFPKIEWSKLSRFESEDHTSVAQELACTAGGCEN